jgi:D-glycero-alpha-D-manno-heptose-7-phosphate kinase
MIISRTPFRISFFGGGTDYPSWYRQHGGAVLATTIDKYCYLTCRHLPPFFEHRFRVVYSFIENVHCIDEIKHPAAREVMRFLNVARGVEVHHDGDLPARSGMGSSSAFTVGLLHALHALQGRRVSKRQLALEGITVEQERLRETVGSQDQVLAAYGGLNHVRFLPSGEINVQPVVLPKSRLAELNDHLMLFFTGINRTASDIAAGYASALDRRHAELRRIEELVEEGLSILCSRADLRGFGELLHESWKLKRSLGANVSNVNFDEIYEQACAEGATGGKLLGAGGGGFVVVFAPPERHAAIRRRLSRLLHVPFRFESLGSQIIFHDEEFDYSEADLARANEPVRQYQELVRETAATPLVEPAPARSHD